MDVLLVSGGSGGHLVPALALAGRLAGSGRCALLSTCRPVDRILSSASRGSLEWLSVDLQGFTPLRRWLDPRFTVEQIRAFRRVSEAVRSMNPDVVVGFGGYLSAAGVLAANRLGIPAVLHEQNVVPGSANRWLARSCRAIAVSFPETAGRFRGHPRVEVTGNPIRLKPGRHSPAEARLALGLDPERPVLLVMGGSQGSRSVNNLAVAMWEQRTPEEKAGAQVLHLAGPLAEQVEAAYTRLGVRHKVIPFLHEMETALSSATLAVSRAGATAITEMAAFGVPAVLVPYPHAKQHQLANARWMERAGGALVLPQEGLTSSRLWEGVSGILRNSARREEMRRALEGKVDLSAAAKLAGLVRQAAKPRVPMPDRTPLVETVGR